MVNFPVGPLTANHGVGSTTMMALMVGWMLQNTCTMPALEKVWRTEVPGL